MTQTTLATAKNNVSPIWKNSRRDQQGTNQHIPSDILNSFNQPFNSVFTPKEPLSLSRFAKMRVQDLKMQVVCP